MNLNQMLERGVLVCDGAMGTMLHAAGNSLDQALPALTLSNPNLVRRIHDSYVQAGSEIIQTNTFGASRLRLAQHDFGEHVEEINQAAVRLAREAAFSVSDRAVLVAGSVSPTVSVQQRRRTHQDERVAVLREQITALVEAGVDVLLLETFGILDELVEAIETVTRISDTPIIAQATFSSDTHTFSGHTPREVATVLADLPIAVLGTNCTLGPQGSLTVLRELRRWTDLPLAVQPNAGLPRRVAAAQFEYDIDSDYFVRYIRQFLQAGASIVGGCCGTTPTQIAAAAQAAMEHRRHTSYEGATNLYLGPSTLPAPAEPEAGTALLAGAGELVGVEVTPPLTGEVEDTFDVARSLSDAGIDMLAISAAESTQAQVNSVNLAVHLHQRLGIHPVASVTTWDRTIMALQADLLGAHALGLRRIVCETGTPPLLGDYPHVDGIWDVDSIGLIELLAGLNDGSDYYGLHVPAKTHFEIGARLNPGSSDAARASSRARDKISAGAQFVITRPVYERAGLEQLLAAVDGQVPVFATIRPLTSFEEAEYLAHEVPDVTVPSETLDALHRAGNDAAQAGFDLAKQLMHDLHNLTSGIIIHPTANPVATATSLARLARTQ